MLATVLFTDCVGFSARMSVNEEHTLDLIRRDLKLMHTICTSFEGRVLKSTGDGLLMCFSSAVKAVECAIAIQNQMAEAIQSLPPSDTLMHRIGIHLADMYITSTDVMGNGVNIAARLQTEADPGGICISQTVYDVAKHGLQLETEYLGPRELKNIREVVPAYRILLDVNNSPHDPYAETVRSLEQSENVSRIRKLILYTCKNYWENDENKLVNLSLKGIIHEFLGLASSYEQLKGLLNSAVGTLSKQTEYTLVANEILKAVAKFYPPEQALQLWQGQLPPATEAAQNLESAAGSDQLLYQQVAQKLDQHLDALRLKKLLYYICRRQWEGDSTRLQMTSTSQLLEEVKRSANDLPQLRVLVDRFVQTLNKRVEYALVATTLVGLLGVLYGEDLAEISTGSPPGLSLLATSNPPEADSQVRQPLGEHQQLYVKIGAQLDQNPQHLRIKKLMVYLCRAQWIRDTTQLASFDTAVLLEELSRLAPTSEQLRQVLGNFVRSLSKQAEYTAIAQTVLQSTRPLYQAVASSQEQSLQESQAQPKDAAQANVAQADAIAVSPESSPAHSDIAPDRGNNRNHARSTISLFDVRLGILKYTNPLKAKILAFSALYSDFHFNEQDWFNLKMYELDGLLQNLVKTCQHYTDLENLLYATARRLKQPDDLIQTADTVIKYLRTYYVHGNPALLATFSTTDETRISLDDFETATQRLADPNEVEQTLGLAPAPPNLSELNASTSDSSSSTRLLLPKGQGSQ